MNRSPKQDFQFRGSQFVGCTANKMNEILSRDCAGDVLPPLLFSFRGISSSVSEARCPTIIFLQVLQRNSVVQITFMSILCPKNPIFQN